MPNYLIQAQFKPEEHASALDRSSDPTKQLEELVGHFGGKLHFFAYSLGEYDAVAICEFSDEASAGAAAMTLQSAIKPDRIKTTALISPAQAANAVGKMKTSKGLLSRLFGG